MAMVEVKRSPKEIREAGSYSGESGPWDNRDDSEEEVVTKVLIDDMTSGPDELEKSPFEVLLERIELLEQKVEKLIKPSTKKEKQVAPETPRKLKLFHRPK
jgi:polyhydroxyalkanoate synthesis regulator phasin